MTLQQLIEKLEELKSKHGENVNVEFITEAADWGFEEDAVAHEIDQVHDWEDTKNQKWVNIYLR